MYLKNKIKLVLLLIFVTTIVENKALQGQGIIVFGKKQPQVLKAVAPTFIPFVFDETGVAEFLIEVKLNSEGNVIAAKTISFSLFKDLSPEETAKKWVFGKDLTRKERVAHIKFVMRIMPESTILSEFNTIYRYPAEIEIRHTVFKGSSNDDPEFDPPIPKKPER